MSLPEPLERLAAEFAKFPGVGQRTALRLALHVMGASREEVDSLRRALADVKERVIVCSGCFNLSSDPVCEICASPERDARMVCVVVSPQDVTAIERTGRFNGRYHVLHGQISAFEGLTPERLRLPELVERCQREGVTEVVVATSAEPEGVATASWIQKRLKPLGVSVTKLARGIPVGTEVEYADPMSLSEALEGRRAL